MKNKNRPLKVDRIIAITHALRETAATVIQAINSIDRDSLREHDRVYINFPDGSKLDEAENLVRQIAASIPSLRDQVQPQIKRRLESLEKLLNHISAPSDAANEILLTKLRPIQTRFKMCYEKFKRDQQTGTDWIALWTKLNRETGKIEKAIREFREKSQNRANYNLIPGAFAPVQICHRGERFLSVPVEIAIGGALVGLCHMFEHCNDRVKAIKIQADELTLARLYASLFLDCDFAGFEIPRDDNPRTGPALQKGLNILLATFRAFLEKLLTALANQTPDRSESEKKSQSVSASISAESAKTESTTSYTVVITDTANVYMKNGRGSLQPQAKKALIGLAVLSKKMEPGSPLRFSTKKLIQLISSEQKDINKRWNRCKKQMKVPMPKLKFEGDWGEYTIIGLTIESQLTSAQLESVLENTCKSSTSDARVGDKPAQLTTSDKTRALS